MELEIVVEAEAEEGPWSSQDAGCGSDEDGPWGSVDREDAASPAAAGPWSDVAEEELELPWTAPAAPKRRRVAGAPPAADSPWD